METLLIFLLIGAIQMYSAYSKQKKEAAKKAAQKNIPLPQEVQEQNDAPETYNIPPEASEPIPDPFEEIRRTLKKMSSSAEEQKREEPEIEPFEPVVEEAQIETEPIALDSEINPYEPIYEKHHLESVAEEVKINVAGNKKNKYNAIINISNPKHGILWSAILQEPRYKVKWKSLAAK